MILANIWADLADVCSGLKKASKHILNCSICFSAINIDVVFLNVIHKENLLLTVWKVGEKVQHLSQEKRDPHLLFCEPMLWLDWVVCQGNGRLGKKARC